VLSEVNGELGERVKSTLTAIREQLLAEALIVFEAEKKKKKVPKG
jgi:adenylate kinase